MKKKQIIWEKYVCPLNSNIDEVEYPGYYEPREFGEEQHIEFLSPQGIKQAEMGEPFDPNEFHVPDTTKVVQTPHGFLTLTEHSYATKHFDFWNLHCNFPITVEIASIIEGCEGVETLNIITRYRCRLGFNRILLQGGAFTLNEIRSGIETAVLGADNKSSSLEDMENLLLFTEDVRVAAIETKKKLSESRYWAVYVLPNGQMETFSEYSRTPQMKDKMELFYKTQELIGGSVFTSGKD